MVPKVWKATKRQGAAHVLAWRAYCGSSPVDANTCYQGFENPECPLPITVYLSCNSVELREGEPNDCLEF